MTKEEEEKAASKSSGDNAKNEAAAAKDGEASNTGTSTVATSRTTATQLVSAKSYERCTVTRNATGKTTQSSKVNTVSSVRTVRADEDSSDEEPPTKKNKNEDKPLSTTSMIATTIVTDVSSTQILNQKTTHDLRDTAAVRQVTDNLLTPLLDACGVREKSNISIKMNSTPNESQNPPQLTLLLSLQVKSNTGAEDIPERSDVHEKPEDSSNVAQTSTAGTILHLEEILQKQQANLPNVALNVTIAVDEAHFAGLSAAEKDKRTEERGKARADLLMHFATYDNLNKKLIPLYLKFLYLADEQETSQEKQATFSDEILDPGEDDNDDSSVVSVSGDDDEEMEEQHLNDILAAELSGEDEEDSDGGGDLEENGADEDDLEDEDYDDDDDAEMDEDDN